MTILVDSRSPQLVLRKEIASLLRKRSTDRAFCSLGSPRNPDTDGRLTGARSVSRGRSHEVWQIRSMEASDPSSSSEPSQPPSQPPTPSALKTEAALEAELAKPSQSSGKDLAPAGSILQSEEAEADLAPTSSALNREEAALVAELAQLSQPSAKEAEANSNPSERQEPKPDKKAIVPSLSSLQLMWLCRRSVLVSLVPMILIVIVSVAYSSDLPDQIATSFNEENIPTGFSSPAKQTIKMLFWCTFCQTAATLAGLTLNPRAFYTWSHKVYSIGGCLDVESLFSPEHLEETTTYVLHGFIWLGVSINSFILSIVWTGFGINKTAHERGATSDPQVWLALEDVPVSACCIKAYALLYFVMVVLVFLVIVGHHLYVGHSVHGHHLSLLKRSREIMKQERAAAKGRP